MPTQDWGVYQDSLTLGTEVSSTYEGRHITATAAELNHGNILGVVTKGYPVIFDIVAGAHGVGIAFNTEVAGTDLIAVDTEGIWNLAVTSSDDLGNSLVVAGDPLYINTTTAIISKIRNNATQIPFGYALSQGNGDGAAHTCAVKVHWDPRSHWLEDMEFLYFGDAMDVNLRWNQVALEMLPLADDTDFLIGNGVLSFNVQIFGDAVGNFMRWDQSENQLQFRGIPGATNPMISLGSAAAPVTYTAHDDVGFEGNIIFPAATGNFQGINILTRLTLTGDGFMTGIRGHATIDSGVTANEAVAGRHCGIEGWFHMDNAATMDGAGENAFGAVGALWGNGTYTTFEVLAGVASYCQISVSPGTGHYTAYYAYQSRSANHCDSMMYFEGYYDSGLNFTQWRNAGAPLLVLENSFGISMTPNNMANNAMIGMIEVLTSGAVTGWIPVMAAFI